MALEALEDDILGLTTVKYMSLCLPQKQLVLRAGAESKIKSPRHRTNAS
jgi:hypothetical protein